MPDGRADPRARRARAARRGALRRPAGHRVGDRRRRRPVAHPVAADHHAVPAARTPTGDGLRVYLCFSLAQGLTRPITPMGLSAFRVIASVPAARLFGVPIADPVAGPPAFVDGRRAGCSPTSRRCCAARSGRAIVPRVLDVMEARSAVVLRALFDDPRLAVRTTSRWPFVRRVARVAGALPGAALRSRSALAAPGRGTPAGRPDRPPAARTLTALPPDAAAAAAAGPRAAGARPQRLPDHAAGRAGRRRRARDARGWRGKLRGRRPRRGEPRTRCCAALPHNATTEMDLELWAPGHAAARRRGAAEALRGDIGGRAGAAATAAARCRRRCSRASPAFLARHGHRAVAEIDLGMPRWSDDPSHVLGVLANYLRLDDPELAPDAVFARGAAGRRCRRRRDGRRVRRRGRVRGRSRCGSRCGGCAQLAGMRETHKDFVIRLLAHARARAAGSWANCSRARAARRRRTTCSSSTSPRRAPRSRGADHRATVAERREEYDRELRRRHVPRVLLSDGTEPEALSRRRRRRGRP